MNSAVSRERQTINKDEPKKGNTKEGYKRTYYEIFTDATHHSENRKGCAAFIIKDSSGKTIKKSSKIYDTQSPGLAESLAIRNAMTYIVSNLYHENEECNFVLHSDRLTLVDGLNRISGEIKRGKTNIERGNDICSLMVGDIKRLKDSISFKWIPRKENAEVDRYADEMYATYVYCNGTPREIMAQSLKDITRKFKGECQDEKIDNALCSIECITKYLEIKTKGED